MAQSPRISYFDIVKLIAIWLVIWGHTRIELMHTDWETDRLFQFIYSFHMPLFMLTSGLFAEKSFSMGLWPITKKKFKQIILPALEMGVVVYAAQCLFGKTFGFVDFCKYEVMNFWFLKALFLCYLIGWVCWKAGRFKWVVFGAITILFLALQHWNITCFKLGAMLPFFAFGILAKRHLSVLQAHSPLLLVGAIICFTLLFHFYSLDNTFLALPFLSISLVSFVNYGIYLATGLMGSVAVIFGCILLKDKTEQTTIYQLLTNIGQHTLGIYLWQNLLLEFLLPQFLSIDSQEAYLTVPITIGISILVLLACYGICIIPQNIRTNA